MPVWQQIVTAATAFTATNVDDILILTLLFSRLPQGLRPVHIVAGQVCGFAVLLLLSLAPLTGRSLLPMSWFGMLGLLPISLGISGWLELLRQGPPVDGPGADAQILPAAAADPPAIGAEAGIAARLFAVAALTIANGSDNIGVYLPLFARATRAELVVMLLTFAVGLALWCLLAWWLTRLAGLAEGLSRWGAWIAPPLLMGLGVAVLLESRCLQSPQLAVIALLCLVAMAASLLRCLEAPAVAGSPFLSTSGRDDQHA